LRRTQHAGGTLEIVHAQFAQIALELVDHTGHERLDAGFLVGAGQLQCDGKFQISGIAVGRLNVHDHVGHVVERDLRRHDRRRRVVLRDLLAVVLAAGEQKEIGAAGKREHQNKCAAADDHQHLLVAEQFLNETLLAAFRAFAFGGRVGVLLRIFGVVFRHVGSLFTHGSPCELPET